MKNQIITSAITCTALFFNACANNIPNNDLQSTQTYASVNTAIVNPPDGSSKIQVALLFDTSNSMDGLLEQAKSRLWDIVNTLTTLKYKGKTPRIEIALYEYGNDGLSSESNFIRQVTSLTTDLDLISEKLFALRTNGGSEYCGAVIHKSIKDLTWDDNASTMKLIYIAGNEGFDQGGINYKEAISDGLKNNIYTNTIFCGNKNEGIELHWENGANKGQGKYFNIDSDQKIQYVQTPYDQQINACNEKLNKTYIGYGKQGYYKKSSQSREDANAQSISTSNSAERAVSKSKAVYNNASWDLVDSYKENEQAIDKLKQEELPEEYKGKTKEEIKAIVITKTKEREAIQKEIGTLATKRNQYIADATKKANTTDDLGTSIKFSIISFAKLKGYEVEQ